MGTAVGAGGAGAAVDSCIAAVAGAGAGAAAGAEDETVWDGSASLGPAAALPEDAEAEEAGEEEVAEDADRAVGRTTSGAAAKKDTLRGPLLGSARDRPPGCCAGCCCERDSNMAAREATSVRPEGEASAPGGPDASAPAPLQALSPPRAAALRVGARAEGAVPSGGDEGTSTSNVLARRARKRAPHAVVAGTASEPSSGVAAVAVAVASVDAGPVEVDVVPASFADTSAVRLIVPAPSPPVAAAPEAAGRRVLPATEPAPPNDPNSLPAVADKPNGAEDEEAGPAAEDEEDADEVTWTAPDAEDVAAVAWEDGARGGAATGGGQGPASPA